MHDEKVIDDAISLFEQANPNNNLYLVGVKNVGDKLIFIKSQNIIKRVYQTDEYNEILLASNKYDAIFVHYLEKNKCRAILKVNKSIPIIWGLFGVEFYYSKFYRKKLFLKRTKNYLVLSGYSLRVSLIRMVYKMSNLIHGEFNLLEKAFQRINYCATPISEEVELINSSIPHSNIKHLPFCYTVLDFIFKDRTDEYKKLGNSIFVGNSNEPGGNHLEVFFLLDKFRLTERKIVVPLSYQKFNSYKAHLKRIGYKLFNNRFMPIDTFMSRDEYIENVLEPCNIAIFNHQRQRALGNIILSLWIGSKVFLSENNLIYVYLKRLGIKVYSVEKDLISENVVEGLSLDDRKLNREILRREFSLASSLERLNLILSIEK